VCTKFWSENLKERPKYRWEDNIRMDISKIQCEGVEWKYLAQDRGQRWVLVNMVMNLQVP
jgi:hypothetical protein